MKRPRPKRLRRLTLRMPDRTFDELMGGAKLAGITPSAFARAAILAYVTEVRKVAEEARPPLRSLQPRRLRKLMKEIADDGA